MVINNKTVSLEEKIHDSEKKLLNFKEEEKHRNDSIRKKVVVPGKLLTKGIFYLAG